MTIYWIQFLAVLLIGIFVQPHLSKKKAKTFLWIVFLILLVVSGGRAFTVGVDTRNYVDLFERIESENFADSEYEIGFLLFVKFLHALFADPGILLIMSSVICIGAACLFTYYFSKNPVLSMTLYILMGAYFFQMTGLRQAIAMSIIEIAFIFLMKKRSAKVFSALLILLATTFHTVAYAGFLPYVLVLLSNREPRPAKIVRPYKKTRTGNVTASWVLGCAAVVGCMAFVGYPVIMLFIRVFFPGYAHYFTGQWSDANYNASLFNTLIQIAFAVAGAMVFGKKPLDKNQRMAVIMLSLSIIFYMLSMRMEIWTRAARLFDIYTYLLWAPAFISEVRKARERFFVNTAVIVSSAVYMLIVLVYRPEWSEVVPYVFR